MSETEVKAISEDVGVRPDRISVTLGETINMGNFESKRIDAGLSTDVKPNETSKEAYNRAVAIVYSSLAEIRSGIKIPEKSGRHR